MACSHRPRQQKAVKIQESTIKAFDRYVAAVERDTQARLDGRKPFVVVDDEPRGRIRLLGGDVIVRAYTEEVAIPGGMVHDWYGVLFIPDVKVEKVLGVLRDFDRYKEIYQDITHSETLSAEGDFYRNRLRFEKNVTLRVVLNAEHEVTFKQVDEHRWYVVSRATKITEVVNPGKPNESELPVGDDSGFLWRMVTSWGLEEADGGVYVQLGTVSLTRRIPFGLEWLIKPYVRSIPRQAMESLLHSTQIAAKTAK